MSSTRKIGGEHNRIESIDKNDKRSCNQSTSNPLTVSTDLAISFGDVRPVVVWALADPDITVSGY